jgi:hypothetical protein
VIQELGLKPQIINDYILKYSENLFPYLKNIEVHDNMYLEKIVAFLSY